MTPTEQDNELREQITPLVIEAIENGTFDGYYGDQIADETWNFLKALITADRKRVALEARIDEISHVFRIVDGRIFWQSDISLAMPLEERIAELKGDK